ncbi:MAG: protein translocase SEC61 complex subunit gamma [Candidatus Woesearchaeota archaeon]
MLNNLLPKFKNFVQECIRVLKVTKKPNNEELKIIVKISGMGILAIGIIGFIIQMMWQFYNIR